MVRLKSIREPSLTMLITGSDQFLHTVTSHCTKLQKLKLDVKPVTNAIVQGIAQLGTTLRALHSKDQLISINSSYALLTLID